MKRRATFQPMPHGNPSPVYPIAQSLILGAAMTAGIGLNLALALALVSIR